MENPYVRKVFAGTEKDFKDWNPGQDRAWTGRAFGEAIVVSFEFRKTARVASLNAE